MKSYGSNRPGTNLACFPAVFGIVVTGGSAIAQLVIDYPRDRGTVVVTFMELLGEIKDQDPGPAYQVLGSDGFRFTRFVLNPDFRETKFVIVDVGGSKDVVVSGRETPREHRKSRRISFSWEWKLDSDSVYAEFWFY